MKIILFDEINTRHVVVALAQALRDLGHCVVETGKIWQGHRFPKVGSEHDAVVQALDDAMQSGCDAVVCMRASSLRASDYRTLRARGVRTAVWLPDDPVLYALTYRHVVDACDVVLHCGNSTILAFYDLQGHRRGVNFPFWIDPAAWQWAYDPATCAEDLVFLGNMATRAKAGRYEKLLPLAGRLHLYGRVPVDSAGMHRGELNGVEEISARLREYRLGLDMPQAFSDYPGTPYDFPGLGQLGTYEIPSRIPLYAALGLPIVSLGRDRPSPHFPEQHAFRDVPQMVLALDGLVGDPDALFERSRRARKRVEQAFSAYARARFLIDLLEERVLPETLSLPGREMAYAQY